VQFFNEKKGTDLFIEQPHQPENKSVPFSNPFSVQMELLLRDEVHRQAQALE